MTPRRLALAMLLGLALAGSTASHAQSPMGAFCGTRPKPPRRYAHVVWIWMENHSYGDIVGSPNAPFINSLIAGCGLATNLPQHHAREPAEIPRRGLGPLAGGAAALPVRLQPVGRVQHHGRQHLRTRAVVE